MKLNLKNKDVKYAVDLLTTEELNLELKLQLTMMKTMKCFEFQKNKSLYSSDIFKNKVWTNNELN